MGWGGWGWDGEAGRAQHILSAVNVIVHVCVCVCVSHTFGDQRRTWDVSLYHSHGPEAC